MTLAITALLTAAAFMVYYTAGLIALTAYERGKAIVDSQ